MSPSCATVLSPQVKADRPHPSDSFSIREITTNRPAFIRAALADESE
jgi:hypothetical protein